VTFDVRPPSVPADTPTDAELRPIGEERVRVKKNPRVGIVTLGNSWYRPSVGTEDDPDSTTAMVEEEA
jgi:hypothetical protein